jgi:hypothetical protein
MEMCRICGARLFEGVAYCTRCYAPVIATDEEIAVTTSELVAAVGPWQAPSQPMEPWRPDERHTRPGDPTVHSRWRSGVLSFSLPIKIAITFLAALGVPLLALAWGGVLGMWLVGVWSISVTPWVLRDLWRRTRIS